MQEKGSWQVTALQHPHAVHILLGERIVEVLDDLLADLEAVVTDMMASPSAPAQGTYAAMYGNNAMLPAEEMESALNKYMDLLYKVSPTQ